MKASRLQVNPNCISGTFQNLENAFLKLGYLINKLADKAIQSRQPREYVSQRDLFSKACNHNRRTSGSKLTLAIVQRVYEDNIKKYGVLTCYLCKQPIVFGDDNLEHIIPISKGGTNDYNNLRVAHTVCNKHKKSKLLGELTLPPTPKQKYKVGCKHIEKLVKKSIKLPKRVFMPRNMRRKGAENF